MKKILLIEDDVVMRENTAEILALSNFEVHTAPNGKKGCLLAKEIIPDLIICDIMMPELDGYGTLHILSLDTKTATIPFIFLSAKAEKSEIRKGMELGADDYLTKPFDDIELLKAIDARLKKSDMIKKTYERSANGLNQFLEHASGLTELSNLSKLSISTSYNKKEMIFHEGDVPNFLYFLDKGKVKLFKTHEDGKEYITNIFSEGDFFGYVALFENNLYSESCLVMEKSNICKIPKNDFLNLLYKNREVANQFIKMLSNQIEGQEGQLIRLAYDSVRKRTATALLSFKNESNSVVISRDDLSKMVGTSVESVIRCLSDFKSDDFIEVNGREITILNRSGLQNIQ